MKRGPLVASAVGFVGLTLLAALLGDVPVGAGPSTLSRGARGWLAARRYLEARGCRVTLLDRPVGPDSLQDPRAVAVASFPWQLREADPGATIDGLEGHLRRGGTLVLAYAAEPWAIGQSAILEAVGLTWQEVRGRPPLLPWRWREFAAAEWTLASADPAQPRQARVEAPRGVPRMPPAGSALWSGEGGLPVVFAYPRWSGRVVVVPADAFGNARLAESGNADLLEQLRVWLGDEWVFDEYHHGLAAAASVSGGTEAAPVLELFLGHLGLVYALAVMAVARRFGPAWAEPAVISGSTTSFLIGLGALHHRLGHHSAAGRLLVERAREVDPRMEWGGVRGGPVSGADSLVALGARISRAQLRRGGER